MRSSQTEVVSPAQNQAWPSSMLSRVPQTVSASWNVQEPNTTRRPVFPGAFSTTNPVTEQPVS